MAECRGGTPEATAGALEVEDKSDSEGDAAEARIAASVIRGCSKRCRIPHMASRRRAAATRAGSRKLGYAKISAARLAMTPVVDMLDEQMQCEVLAALPLEDIGAAEQTCKS